MGTLIRKFGGEDYKYGVRFYEKKDCDVNEKDPAGIVYLLVSGFRSKPTESSVAQPVTVMAASTQALQIGLQSLSIACVRIAWKNFGDGLQATDTD